MVFTCVSCSCLQYLCNTRYLGILTVVPTVGDGPLQCPQKCGMAQCIALFLVVFLGWGMVSGEDKQKIYDKFTQPPGYFYSSMSLGGRSLSHLRNRPPAPGAAPEYDLLALAEGPDLAPAPDFPPSALVVILLIFFSSTAEDSSTWRTRVAKPYVQSLQTSSFQLRVSSFPSKFAFILGASVHPMPTLEPPWNGREVCQYRIMKNWKSSNR